MKKLLLLLTLLTFSISYSQTNKKGDYFNLTKISFVKVSKSVSYYSDSYEISEYENSTKDSSNYNLETINGIYLNKKTSLGVGIGLNGYQDNPTLNTLPIYLDYRVYFNDTPQSPFMYVDYGKLLKFWDTFEKGWLFNVGVGYKFKSSRKSQLVTSLSYNHKGVSLTYDSYSKSNDKYKLGGFGLNLGFIF